MLQCWLVGVQFGVAEDSAVAVEDRGAILGCRLMRHAVEQGVVVVNGQRARGVLRPDEAVSGAGHQRVGDVRHKRNRLIRKAELLSNADGSRGRVLGYRHLGKVNVEGTAGTCIHVEHRTVGMRLLQGVVGGEHVDHAQGGGYEPNAPDVHRRSIPRSSIIPELHPVQEQIVRHQDFEPASLGIAAAHGAVTHEARVLDHHRPRDTDQQQTAAIESASATPIPGKDTAAAWWLIM